MGEPRSCFACLRGAGAKREGGNLLWRKHLEEETHPGHWGVGALLLEVLVVIRRALGRQQGWRTAFTGEFWASPRESRSFSLCIWLVSFQPSSLAVADVLQLGLVKMADGEEDPAVFSCRSLPSDPRLMATVTNAYLGTRVYRDILHVSGVYNGAAGDTHRADLPSPLSVRMAVPSAGSLAETFTLNTRTGKERGEGSSFLGLPSPCLGLPLLCPSKGSLLEVKSLGWQHSVLG